MWGRHKSEDNEKVHLSFPKRILKIRTSTVNYMVYCDLERFPMVINRYCRMIKYWFKLLTSENCIWYNCYQDMYERCCLRYNDKFN